MNTPLGHNPIGQHAAGLPRHDAGLPGHVPGMPTAQLGGGGAAFPTAGGGGAGGVYGGGVLPDSITRPLARCIFFGWVYLTAPLQAALYPMAGLAGAAGAGLLYLYARMLGGGYDMTHEWAWNGCFFGVVALMRFETNFEAGHPGYVTLRRRLRLALSFAWMFYFGIHDQGTPAGVALVVAALFTVIMHFLLKSTMLRAAWHIMQNISWMRKSV
jgi:hypothetical protein